jgi:hypothetical protein
VYVLKNAIERAGGAGDVKRSEAIRTLPIPKGSRHEITQPTMAEPCLTKRSVSRPALSVAKAGSVMAELPSDNKAYELLRGLRK